MKLLTFSILAAPHSTLLLKTLIMQYRNFGKLNWKVSEIGYGMWGMAGWKKRKNNIAIIARVPFDEGSLTGTLNTQSTWDKGDFINLYFWQENLIPTLERVQNLTNELPSGMSLPKSALRFIKHHPAVSTVIPGMRKIRNVENNMKIGSDKNESFTQETLAITRKNRWDRQPTKWSY